MFALGTQGPAASKVTGMGRIDRLERLTDLVLLLVSTARPLTLREIVAEVPGYPDGGDALRQAFERDKRTLRDEGIPVRAEPLGGEAQIGYRIRPSDFYLPDLGLSVAEQVALNLAVAGVRAQDLTGRDALVKLGCLDLATRASPIASLPSIPALVPLYEIARGGDCAQFSYRGERRLVSPNALAFRRGHWYLLAWDHTRRAPRTFRVDRIEGSPRRVQPPAGSGPPPGSELDLDQMLELGPWGSGPEESVTARIWVDRIEAPRVRQELSSALELKELPGQQGAIEVLLEVGNRTAFRDWLLGMLHHAVVLGPADLREEITTWLEAFSSRAATVAPSDLNEMGWSFPSGSAPSALAALGETHRDSDASYPGFAGAAVSEAKARGLKQGDPTVQPSGTRSRTGAPRPDAGARLHRLLALLSWLARVHEASLEELTERFGLSREELIGDLELAACCGLPPYTPDQLMELIVGEDKVIANLGPELARPRRLTAAEGFALAASAKALLEVPGTDGSAELSSALEKLERALGDRAPVSVDLGDPPQLSMVADAVARGERIQIEYHAASTDEVTLRMVDPRAVVFDQGYWYLDAWCYTAGGPRWFRIDRIRESHLVGEPVDSTLADRWAEGIPRPGPEVVEAVVLVPAERSWVLEEYRWAIVAKSQDGSALIKLPVGGSAWLERVMLVLGARAAVLSPESLVDAGRNAAKRVLEAYREHQPN